MLKRFVLSMICVAGLASATWADVDMATTQRGGAAPSGSRDEMDDDQDDAILLEINNEIASRTHVVTDPVSPLSTTTAMDSQTTGEILDGASAPEAGGTRSRALYDRLNMRAVLRLLLFDQGELDGAVPIYPPAPVPHSFEYPHREAPISSGGGSPDTTPDPAPIPEPATIVLMVGAGALAVARRRRLRQQPAAPPVPTE